MKTAWLSSFHSKHCPGPLRFPFGSIATREIEQNRLENGVVPITSGHTARGVEHVTQHELFTLSPWYILSDGDCPYCTTADMLRTRTTFAAAAAIKVKTLANIKRAAITGALWRFLINKQKLRLHSLLLTQTCV